MNGRQLRPRTDAAFCVNTVCSGLSVQILAVNMVEMAEILCLFRFASQRMNPVIFSSWIMHCHSHIATDKAQKPTLLIVFLFLHKKSIVCGYSLEAPQ